MNNRLTVLTPEGFDIADAYIMYGSVEDTAAQTGIARHEIVTALQKPEVKRYLDGVYLDAGYRNRNKIGAALDRIIEKKLEDAEETEVFTNKDLVDLLTLAHKIRIDEAKMLDNNNNTKVAVQIANFGEGNYGKLMEKLIGSKTDGN